MEKLLIPKQEAWRHMAEDPRGEIMAMLESSVPAQHDVTHFIPYDKGYYAILRNGARLDIVRIQAFQPPIENFEDYFSYLLIETLDSFFILRQRVLENRTLPWQTMLELRPVNPAGFFRSVCGRPDMLEALVMDI